MQARRFARSWTHAWLPLTSFAMLACLPSSPEPTAQNSSSIIEGRAARACEWPAAALVLPSGCSAALIHPRAFVTAAHCLYDASGRVEAASSVLFGERPGEPDASRDVDTCFLSTAEGGDLAVCVLREPAPDIPIIPIMAGCESEWLVPGATAIEVGFGDETSSLGYQGGTKSWLEVYVVRARSDEPYLEVSAGNQAGEYYGDSGGPLYFKMPDGTWRLVGTDSGSPDIVDGSTAPRFSAYANAAYFVPWAEQVTGVDLTPCHDESGWRPTADCASFPATGPYVVDSWSSDCREQPAANPLPTCPVSGAGAAGKDADPDDSPAPRSSLEAGGCSQAGANLRSLPSWLTSLALLLAATSRRHHAHLFFVRRKRRPGAALLVLRSGRGRRVLSGSGTPT
jgi:hypothetical protein